MLAFINSYCCKCETTRPWALSCRQEAVYERNTFKAKPKGCRGLRLHETTSAIVPVTPETKETHGLTRPAPAKEKKTAEELAAMIRQDLSKVEGCPERGVSVTVYGLNPWNSLLTFGVDAGPVPNKADLQNFCDIITERLKRLYDVSVVERP